MKIKSIQLNASILRIVLGISLFLIIAVGVAGFTFAHQKLTDYAAAISKKNVDAQASETTIQSLQTISEQLDRYAEARKVAEALRLDEDHPEFAVNNDLKAIAARNNIDISLTTEAPAAEGGTTPPAAGTTPNTPPVTPGTFSITMEVRPKSGDVFNKTTYRDFLQFLRDLEQHLPKIKINGVTVSSSEATESEDGTPTGGGTQGISVDPISLEVYVKE